MSEKTDSQIRLQKGFDLPQEKHYYFTGFAITISPADLMITLESTGQAIALLKTPHSVAKTLVEKLSNVISSFEEGIEYEITSLEDIEQQVRNAKANANDQ